MQSILKSSAKHIQGRREVFARKDEIPEWVPESMTMQSLENTPNIELA